MMADTPFLRVEDLTVEFTSGGYTVRPLDGISFTAPRGSLALLLGPSGCGKTTLLSCLAAILTPTAGSVTVGGIDVGSLSGAALTAYRRHDVGIVFQAFNLVPSLSALENVMVPLRADGRSRTTARDVAAELLERVGMSERAGHRPGNLSGGQQQRVAIARAVALAPTLILADEPTAHLDYIQVEAILRLLRGLADDGHVIIVSTHDDRMLPLADEVIEMQPRFLEDRGDTTVTRSLVDGEVLFHQGDPADFIYVVERGEIEILRAGEDGALLRLAGPGDYFGEMGPLFGLPRTAMARSRGESTLTALSTGAFRSWLGDDHKLTEVIAGRSTTASPPGPG